MEEELLLIYFLRRQQGEKRRRMQRWNVRPLNQTRQRTREYALVRPLRDVDEEMRTNFNCLKTCLVCYFFPYFVYKQGAKPKLFKQY